MPLPAVSARRALAAAALALVAPAARPLHAQLSTDKYQVHGYLTQGFAATDSLPILGIGRKATGDYRAAALQVRVTPTAKDAAVVQVANRRVGASAVNRLEDDLTLQWAYYQRRLPAGLVAKAGRAPMPRGIYNEVRKVGTVLPFYRAPYNFYTESYETVDGAVLARTTGLGRWELESSVFGGTVDFRQAGRQTLYKPNVAVVNGTPTMVGVTPARDSTYLVRERANGAVGGQLWLSTPLDGLRVGAGATRFKLDAYQQFSGRNGPSVASVAQGAVDGNFTRFQLRGEWEQLRVHEFLYTAHYAQAGVKLTERLSLNAQREQATVHVAARPIILGVPAEQTPRARRVSRIALDHAVGVNFAFRPNAILKVEGHQNRGTSYDVVVTGAPRGRYVIGSLALSF